MSTTKHTPGPWTTGDRQTFRRHGVFAENNLLIADCRTNLADDPARANAILVASAPDLLEACRDALDIANSYSHIPALGKACAILIAAIAKAEGGGA